MTHEIKSLFETLETWQLSGKRSVFVSVVALQGSSYRKPGVRMIISEDGESAGAVSGGCVEKEIERQAQSVFQTGKPKIITYDGRLRIGCEGIIHILIEPVFLSDEFLLVFNSVLKSRKSFRMDSYYHRVVGEYNNIGTVVHFENKTFSLHPEFTPENTEDMECFPQLFEPLFQLFIFGAEHDAVQLCKSAKLLGWEVTVVASPDESKSCSYFPGADSLIAPSFDKIDTSLIDNQTAVVIMTHSFSKDIQYLLALKNTDPAYIGLLGSSGRKERILSMLLEYSPETPIEFLEQIKGPAGLNIGAVGAGEIAVSVLAEILSVVRIQNPVSLTLKAGTVHS